MNNDVNNINIEEKLKRAAELYVKRTGEALLSEANEIERQRVSYITPRADKTVRELSAKQKRPRRRNAVFGVAATAACILIAVRLVTSAPSAPDAINETTNDAYAPEPPPYTQTGMIPISFVMPADYRVKASDLDNGVSVYALESSSHGDVVLTMYYETDAESGWTEADAGFDEVRIDGTSVPAKVNEAYKLLAFEAGGLRYTLSSESDLGALAAFYRNIQEAVPV